MKFVLSGNVMGKIPQRICLGSVLHLGIKVMRCLSLNVKWCPCLQHMQSASETLYVNFMSLTENPISLLQKKDKERKKMQAVVLLKLSGKCSLMQGVTRGSLCKCLFYNLCYCRYEYHWADGQTIKKPIKCSAPKYIDYLMTWVQDQLDDETLFPSKIGTQVYELYFISNL